MLSVYIATDDAGTVRYVGHTRNLARRSAEWAERGRTVRELFAIEDFETALGVEQRVIEAFNDGRRL